jgi:hypothetical protein
MHVINGKKFDPDTSEQLHSSGSWQACSRPDGELTVYRSKKGTVWAVFRYWPNEFGAQHVETVADDATVRRLCESLNRPSALESTFGELEEG